MKRAAAIALVLASLVAEAGPRFKRFCGRTRDGVTKRGFNCASYAAFELAPQDGAGMGSACACTAVTSAQGGAVSWTRSGSAYCSKKGNTVTGIAEGDLVYCGNNLPRVEPDSTGTLGFRVEGTRNNNILRSAEFNNAAWTNSVTVTANSATAPDGTLTADTLDDTSGGASQSSSQAYISVGALYFVGSVYVKAGSLSAVRVRVSGSGGGVNTCTASGLSTTTWTRAKCGATLTTNATITILPGTADADTGTVYVWGAQLETSTSDDVNTSYVPTVAAVATRPDDGNEVTVALSMVPSSWAASVTGMRLGGNRQMWVGVNTTFVRGWQNGSGNIEADRDTPGIAATNGAAVATARYAGRYVTNGASATVTVCTNGTCGATTTSNSTTAATSTSARFGYNSVAGYHIDGIISRICNDPDSTRCL